MRRLVIFLCLISIAGAQQSTTPKLGSAERKVILNALRSPVEKDLKQKVVFHVDHMKVNQGWCFVSGKTMTPAGKAIDYRKTKYRDALEAGVFDDWICALLRRTGSKWKVITYSIGATDVVWDGWDKKYKAPRAIFPYPKG